MSTHGLLMSWFCQEGVVFALSGFVNPERASLRSKALEMGAEYQPDWTSDCTILVCAFPNTPKFRQVKSDGGTIVSKVIVHFHLYNIVHVKCEDMETFVLEEERSQCAYCSLNFSITCADLLIVGLYRTYIPLL